MTVNALNCERDQEKEEEKRRTRERGEWKMLNPLWIHAVHVYSILFWGLLCSAVFYDRNLAFEHKNMNSSGLIIVPKQYESTLKGHRE